MFTWPTQIRLYDTDASGRIFYASLFRIAHDAVEAFMESRNHAVSRYLSNSDCTLAIAHAEADYTAPMQTGDKVDVNVSVERVGNASFTITYQFVVNGRETARAKTIHVSIATATGTSCPLPGDLRALLA